VPTLVALLGRSVDDLMLQVPSTRWRGAVAQHPSYPCLRDNLQSTPYPQLRSLMIFVHHCRAGSTCTPYYVPAARTTRVLDRETSGNLKRAIELWDAIGKPTFQ
jgi:hypothetical protein